MKQAAADPWIRWLLVAYMFLLPLRRIYFLPGFGSRFQLTELAFLLLAPLLAYRLLQLREWPKASALTLGFAAYLSVLAVSTFAPPTDARSLVEWLGRSYLLLLFAGVAAYLHRWPDGVARLIRAWSRGSLVMGASAYLGYGLAMAGHLTPLVSVYENYPYFGTLYRATGVAGGATAFVLLSIVPCVASWLRWRTRGTFPFVLLFLALPLVLTFSKEVLLLVLAVGIADPAVRPRKWMLYPALVLGAGLYWFTTHYIVQPVQEIAGSAYAQEEFTSGEVVWRGEDFQLLETSYVSLKRAALLVGLRHPWGGVGADGFPLQLPALRAEGRYPAHLPDYIPHSTWFGAFSEGGFPGLAAVFVMAWSLLRRGRAVAARIAEDDLQWCLVAFFAAVAIGSLNMDLLHLRFFWIAAALLVGGGLPAHRTADVP